MKNTWCGRTGYVKIARAGKILADPIRELISESKRASEREKKSEGEKERRGGKRERDRSISREPKEYKKWN